MGGIRYPHTPISESCISEMDRKPLTWRSVALSLLQALANGLRIAEYRSTRQVRTALRRRAERMSLGMGIHYIHFLGVTLVLIEGAATGGSIAVDEDGYLAHVRSCASEEHKVNLI